MEKIYNFQICNFPLNLNNAYGSKEQYFERLKEEERYKIGPFYCARSNSTHTGVFKHAIDFLVPVGTPVLAVKDGKVISIEENNEKFGNDKTLKSNHITIGHFDGNLTYNTYSEYMHLEPNSPSRNGIKVGSFVKAGQVIANVGNVGYMIYDEKKGPLSHLHFHLGEVRDDKFFTIKPEFETKWFFNLYSFIDSFKEFVYGLMNKLRIA